MPRSMANMSSCSAIKASDRIVDKATEAFPGVFMNDAEDFEGFARGGRVKLKVNTPDVFCLLRSDFRHC